MALKAGSGGKSLDDEQMFVKNYPFEAPALCIDCESSWINRRREFVNKFAIKIAKKRRNAKTFSSRIIAFRFLLFPTIVIPSIVLVVFNKPKSLTFSHHVENVKIWQNFFIEFFSPFFASSSRTEPRKEKTDSSNGHSNALSPQEQHQQQVNLQMMSQQQQDRGGGMGGEPMIKPERPNSLGPKISKRINFYHDNCKYFGVFHIFFWQNVGI